VRGWCFGLELCDRTEGSAAGRREITLGDDRMGFEIGATIYSLTIIEHPQYGVRTK